MVFSSSFFLFAFLPAVLFLYFIVDRKFKNLVLLLASLFFYGWGEPKNVFLMLLAILINYVCGLGIEKDEKRKNLYLIIAVVFDLGNLFVFKYLNFSVDTVNSIFGLDIHLRNIALPIGISFYTFQIMSYIIDVYRKEVPAQRNILNLALYLSLFPQLIAGPIVRYIDVEKEIKTRESTWNGIYSGVMRFCVGFSKKVLLADQLSSLVDIAFSGVPSMLLKWVGIIAYALQIYFDFSGYSDMAIGLGEIFGFHFLENFNYPYISRSIKEFWRRWHISLSTWFRDYLYIPLGGSRKGPVRTYVNLMIVFFTTGLWHGASFNFIVWGLYYAVFLVLERQKWGKILDRLPRIVQHLYALIIVLIGWVFFRANDLTAALDYIRGMFTLAGDDLVYLNYHMNLQYWLCIVLGVLFAVPVPKQLNVLSGTKGWQYVKDAGIMLIFYIAVCYMVGSGYSPFLYFRF